VSPRPRRDATADEVGERAVPSGPKGRSCSAGDGVVLPPLRADCSARLERLEQQVEEVGSDVRAALGRYWIRGRFVTGRNPNSGGRCARRNSRLVALAPDIGGHSHCHRGRRLLLPQAQQGGLTPARPQTSSPAPDSLHRLMAPGGVEPPRTDSKSVALSAELRGPAHEKGWRMGLEPTTTWTTTRGSTN
jgi:hypothetical protein